MLGKWVQEVVCLECGHREPLRDVQLKICAACGSGWLDARYAYAEVAALWRAGLGGRETGLWRYGELLPIDRSHPQQTLGEGWTPLTRLYPYEQRFGFAGELYLKDERAQPTNSFKDRQAALSVMAMTQAGVQECVLASTGNAAVAYAAYCARAGIKLWLFIPSLVTPEKLREAALYGAEVVKVSGTYDETKQVAAEFAQRKGIVFDRGARSIPGKESMKTMAYEIAEQLGLRLRQAGAGEAPWVAPDWYIQAVSGGIGPLGVMKGFAELKQMGLTDKVPKLAVIQAAGCAPMVSAYAAKQRKATPVIPKTLITVLATGDPGYGYSLLYDMVEQYGGTMLGIEDGEAFSAMRRAASVGGYSVEPATAVAFAGLERLLQAGMLGEQARVVLNCSGHTFPAESHILGDQYERYVLDLQLNKDAKAPHEQGLGAALKELDEQVTTIVLVDDNANDRRLIRRLLQSYKNYRVYEARDGQEALRVVEERQPDLVVSDLTMPQMDGFTLLERLKANPKTAHIPVMVVSAKALSDDDRQALEQFASGVFQKGGFDTHSLVEQVVTALGQQSAAPGLPKTGELKPLEASEQATHSILLIDDNAHDLRLARRILQSGGRYSILEADSGREGLKAAYTYHPDLIVLDLSLPDLDGMALLEALGKDSQLCETPIVVYTARELDASSLLSQAAQVRRVISKTALDRRLFLEAIREVLGQNQAKQSE